MVFTAVAPTHSEFRLRTGLPVHHVPTHSLVLTGSTGALIDIHLAVDAIKPRLTFTRVHADQVMAGGCVVAGTGLTLVDFNFTVDSWSRTEKSG